MGTLLGFFLPDSLSENSTQRRRGRLTLLITLVVIAACVVYSGAHYRWGFSEGILILWSGGAALCSVPILLKNGTAPSLAAKCTAVLMWLLLSLLMIRSGGIGSTSTPWLVVPPLIALLLAGQRFATLVAGLTVVEIAVTHGLELNGVTFPMPFSEEMLAESFFSSYVGLVVVIFLIARLFKNGQQRAMDRAHAAKEEAKAQKEETEKMAERLREQKSSVEQQVEEATSKLRKQKETLTSHAQEMLEAMDRFAYGDLTVRVQTDRDDEIGRLFDGFNRAVESVRQTLSDVRGATERTASATEQITASSEQMAASAEEQSTQAEEVAAAVEQLNQTINENARSVQQTAEVAEAGGKQARRGGKIVREATGKMEGIASTVGDTTDTIERLGTYGRKIDQVVDRIAEIADQTNLLALNAAIEAARAGEGGKGFAVVAEEVRELAEEADAATDEIEEMMDEVRREIEEAVGTARQSRQRTEDGLELANQADEALQEIMAAIEKVEERTDEIAAASEEQSTTSEEIARSVQSISTAAQESAAGVTQVSDSARALATLTEELQKNVQQFDLGAMAEVDSFGKPTDEPVSNRTSSPTTQRDESNRHPSEEVVL